LQHELVSLKRRQATLEDELLEIMEVREEADSSVAEIGAKRAALAAELAELEAARDAAFGEIDAAVALRRAERDSIVAEIPADLLALYERAREHGGGVGAAMLRHRRCEGCHIELSGSELTAVRSAALAGVSSSIACSVRTCESDQIHPTASA